MCRRQLLQTKPTRLKQIERRGVDEASMPYAQIQYYNDCIRAYADKRGETVDVAFRNIENNHLLSVMEQSFRDNKKVFVAVRRMQAAVR